MSSKSPKEIIRDAQCWQVTKSYWRALGKDHMIELIENIVTKKIKEHEGTD